MNYEIGTTLSGLKMGFTTGSCGAAAAKAAAEMLLSGEEIRQVYLMTPKGIELYLDVECISRAAAWVQCAVRKYSGDDPDVTDGLLVFARVERISQETDCTGYEDWFCDLDTPARCEIQWEKPEDSGGRIFLDGGTGVGRITVPGLEQRIGQAAINRVPRKMIFNAVREICDRHDCTDSLKVVISIPEGEKTAKNTFNPRLGIRGGLSVLGTTGIVEPMSEKALTDTIFLEMKMLRENGCSYCYVVPGNYGSDFLRETLGLDRKLAVMCSNYVGETIDDAKVLGMKGMLLVGHVGKFIKLAAGVMNTHSRQADCRMEVLGAHAAMAGAGADTVCRIMACINTSEALKILRQENMLGAVMETVMKRIRFYLENRAGMNLEIGAVMFSLEDGILGTTENAGKLIRSVQNQRNGVPNECEMYGNE